MPANCPVVAAKTPDPAGVSRLPYSLSGAVHGFGFGSDSRLNSVDEQALVDLVVVTTALRQAGFTATEVIAGGGASGSLSMPIRCRLRWYVRGEAGSGSHRSGRVLLLAAGQLLSRHLFGAPRSQHRAYCTAACMCVRRRARCVCWLSIMHAAVISGVRIQLLASRDLYSCIENVDLLTDRMQIPILLSCCRCRSTGTSSDELVPDGRDLDLHVDSS